MVVMFWIRRILSISSTKLIGLLVQERIKLVQRDSRVTGVQTSTVVGSKTRLRLKSTE